jgi:hypothetical protein
MEHLQEGFFLQMSEIYLLGVWVYFGKIGGIHREEGQLKVKGLRFCKDGEVAVGIVGEVFSYAFVDFCINFEHLLL